MTSISQSNHGDEAHSRMFSVADSVLDQVLRWPRTGWTPGASSATLEPVTAPAGARAAHPPPSTPARDHPHQPGNPRFAGTSRRQDLQTQLDVRPDQH